MGRCAVCRQIKMLYLADLKPHRWMCTGCYTSYVGASPTAPFEEVGPTAQQWDAARHQLQELLIDLGVE